MTDILFDAIVTARKAHLCDECQRRIQIGARYRKQVQADHGIETYRAHEDCDKAATEYRDLSDFDFRYGEPHPLSEGVEPEDRPWLLQYYPEVAERLGIRKKAA